ncbi:MAG: hypothetical protein ABSH05_18370 [Bryobacteraceae bacterium]|jgi:hypothetical protein
MNRLESLDVFRGATIAAMILENNLGTWSAVVAVGSAVILFDPVFQGLAIALMAGEIASLVLSRMTVPIVYFVVNRRRAKRKKEVRSKRRRRSP